jgi:hypothetical protein
MSKGLPLFYCAGWIVDFFHNAIAVFPASGAQFQPRNIGNDFNATAVRKICFNLSHFYPFRFSHSTIWYRQIKKKKLGKENIFLAQHLLIRTPTNRGVFSFCSGNENYSQKAPGGPKKIRTQS